MKENEAEQVAQEEIHRITHRHISYLIFYVTTRSFDLCIIQILTKY